MRKCKDMFTYVWSYPGWDRWMHCTWCPTLAHHRLKWDIVLEPMGMVPDL